MVENQVLEQIDAREASRSPGTFGRSGILIFPSSWPPPPPYHSQHTHFLIVLKATFATYSACCLHDKSPLGAFEGKTLPISHYGIKVGCSFLGAGSDVFNSSSPLQALPTPPPTNSRLPHSWAPGVSAWSPERLFWKMLECGGTHVGCGRDLLIYLPGFHHLFALRH